MDSTPVKMFCYLISSQLKMTPLHWATERQHKDVVDTLVKNDADVTCLNKVGICLIPHKL